MRTCRRTSQPLQSQLESRSPQQEQDSNAGLQHITCQQLLTCAGRPCQASLFHEAQTALMALLVFLLSAIPHPRDTLGRQKEEEKTQSLTNQSAVSEAEDAHGNCCAENMERQQGLQKAPGSYFKQFPQLIKLFSHARSKVHKIIKRK